MFFNTAAREARRVQERAMHTERMRQERMSRRVRASLTHMEATIAAGQNRGLTPTHISHYPDGRTVVHFGDDVNAEVNPRQTGWEDI